MKTGWVLAVAVASLLAGGCGTGSGSSTTFTGQVSEVTATRVCVGARAATGECFVRDDTTRSLRVSQCVRVTYAADSGGAGPATASTVSIQDAAAHRDDCPAN